MKGLCDFIMYALWIVYDCIVRKCDVVQITVHFLRSKNAGDDFAYFTRREIVLSLLQVYTKITSHFFPGASMKVIFCLSIQVW